MRSPSLGVWIGEAAVMSSRWAIELGGGLTIFLKHCTDTKLNINYHP